MKWPSVGRNGMQQGILNSFQSGFCNLRLINRTNVRMVHWDSYRTKWWMRKYFDLELILSGFHLRFVCHDFFLQMSGFFYEIAFYEILTVLYTVNFCSRIEILERYDKYFLRKWLGLFYGGWCWNGKWQWRSFWRAAFRLWLYVQLRSIPRSDSTFESPLCSPFSKIEGTHMIKWGASSRWSSPHYCPCGIRTKGPLKKTHRTL